MPLFKIWNSSRTVRKFVTADDLKSLIENGNYTYDILCLLLIHSFIHSAGEDAYLLSQGLGLEIELGIQAQN